MSYCKKGRECLFNTLAVYVGLYNGIVRDTVLVNFIHIVEDNVKSQRGVKGIGKRKWKHGKGIEGGSRYYVVIDY